MNVVVLPAALAELQATADYYRTAANVPLALAFIAEFERTLGMLQANPQLGAIFRPGYRRYPLRRFPYGLIYQFDTYELRVVAVAHFRRRPRYWSQRTSATVRDT